MYECKKFCTVLDSSELCLLYSTLQSVVVCITPLCSVILYTGPLMFTVKGDARPDEIDMIWVSLLLLIVLLIADIYIYGACIIT